MRYGGGLTAPTVTLPRIPSLIFPTAAIAPVIDFDQTRYAADNLTLQTESINVRNSATGASINVGVAQNALSVNGSVPPLP